jgi:TrmH family RNA methyltransferase
MKARHARLDSARRIASRDNPLYRDLLQLAGLSGGRKRREVSLIEGVHLCEAFLSSGIAPLRVVVADDALQNPQLLDLLHRFDIEPVILSANLYRPLSALDQGGGLAVVFNTPRPTLPDRIEQDTVYLDRLQDPGNVGTILRTCAAVGVRTVITAPGTAWCWSPKVLRAGMGAHFHLSILEAVAWSELRPRISVEVRATAAAAPSSLWTTDLAAPGLWLLGQEGSGLAPELLAQASRTVAIPQSESVESLNVGVAAALCLYEQLRQRQTCG